MKVSRVLLGVFGLLAVAVTSAEAQSSNASPHATAAHARQQDRQNVRRVPELDVRAAGAGLALLVGGALVVLDRRRRAAGTVRR